MLWLAKHRAAEFAATQRWLSFPEFLFEKLFGSARASTSMVSATGLWNQNTNDYDDETLRAIGVDRAQLADPAELDQPLCDLLPEYRAAWPGFNGIPVVPRPGRRRVQQLGSGCVAPDRFALMVGTTGRDASGDRIAAARNRARACGAIAWTANGS